MKFQKLKAVICDLVNFVLINSKTHVLHNHV